MLEEIACVVWLYIAETLYATPFESLNVVLNAKLARHPERNNSIRMLELNNKSARTFLKWIYKDSNIHLQRKYDRYLKQIEYENSLAEIRVCSVDGCNKKHRAKGYCKNHYYKFCLVKKN